MSEVLDIVYDLYVTCPFCDEIFRVNKGSPRTTEEYRPSLIEEQENVILELEEGWRKKVSQARDHQRTIGVGNVLEKIAPILPDYPLDPRDARYIGGIAPCDIMSLDGYADDAMKSLTFIEIKAGKTLRLSRAEQRFKKIIDDGEIYYDQLNFPIDKMLKSSSTMKRREKR